MSNKNDFQEFSEDAAVKFIRERLSEDVASRLSDDDILDIVDAAYDYYDDNGLLDLSDFDSDVDERKMASAIKPARGRTRPTSRSISTMRIREASISSVEIAASVGSNVSSM